MKVKSIARRIAKLELALAPWADSKPRPGSGWGRSGASSPAPIQVRFGNLCRLPADYQGERHTVLTKSLPDRNGQKWVEFEEVRGPAPSEPPRDPRLPMLIDVVFVPAYP